MDVGRVGVFPSGRKNERCAKRDRGRFFPLRGSTASGSWDGRFADNTHHGDGRKARASRTKALGASGCATHHHHWRGEMNDFECGVENAKATTRANRVL
jgi:hypothetical protein